MAVGLEYPGKLHPVAGIRLGAMHCGIKSDKNIKDLVLIEMAEESSLAAVFTQNKFCAAPVIISKKHLSQTISENSHSRYLLINSGNANAGTGKNGIEHALACCETLATAARTEPAQVLPFSTGVIAAELPVEKIQAVTKPLLKLLNSDNWLSAAQGIMTTDTIPKAFSKQLEVDGQLVTITGIAKGSGMIKPDMATMLAFVATDAKIQATELQSMLNQVVSTSFNAISVDGDTSTNDSCILMATGDSDVKVSSKHQGFLSALEEIFQLLAQAIIRDAEGATKFVEITVDNAASIQDAKSVAYTVAHSPLVKTALFASDPNWGRILAAVGRAPIENLDIDKVDLFLGDVCLLKSGLPDPSYNEDLGQAEMNKAEINIRVVLNQGDQKATVWTSDLSYDYVKINAEYRS